MPEFPLFAERYQMFFGEVTPRRYVRIEVLFLCHLAIIAKYYVVFVDLKLLFFDWYSYFCIRGNNMHSKIHIIHEYLIVLRIIFYVIFRPPRLWFARIAMPLYVLVNCIFWRRKRLARTPKVGPLAIGLTADGIDRLLSRLILSLPILALIANL